MGDIFVAYNTDSIMRYLFANTFPTGFKKLRKYVNSQLNYTQDEIITAIKPWGSIAVPKSVCDIRKATFEIIKEYYSSREPKYNLYFDILNTVDSSDLTNNFNKNAKEISLSKAVIFVVDYTEISFWQLQEAYFASYYNKKVLCLKTEDFLKLVSSGKITKAIDKLLRKNVNSM